MAIVQLPIPDTDTTVLHPVVFAVVRDLMERTFISPDTEIRYGGVFKSIAQPGTAIGNAENEFVKYGGQPALDVEVNVRMSEEMAATNNQYQINNPAIFYDDQVGVVIRPDYTFKEIRLTMRIVGRSRVAMRLWIDELRNKLQAGRQVFLHQVQYSYHFHHFVGALLKQVHTMRETVAPYGEHFEEYLQNFFGPKVTELANNSGEYSTLVVTESMRNIQGWFDFALTPDDSEQSDNKVNEELTVTYTLQLDFPSSLHVQYPIVVHNQLLPEDFRYGETTLQDANTGDYSSFTNNQNRFFSMDRLHASTRARQGYAYPAFDDFVPDMVLANTNRLVTTLVQLETESPGGPLLNLLDLEDFEWDPRVLEFLRTEATYVTKTYGSIFQLHLFEGNKMLVASDSIRMDENLDIVHTKATSFRRVYHVRLSIVNNIALLDDDAINRLPPGLIVDIIDDLYPDIEVCWLDRDNPDPYEIQRVLNVLRFMPKGTKYRSINCEHSPGGSGGGGIPGGPWAPGGPWDPEFILPKSHTVGGFWIRALREDN